MNQVIVTLADREEVRGLLERFDTALPDFVLRTAGGTTRRIRFADVLSVGFLVADDKPLELEASADRLVTVRFFDGGAARGVLEPSEGPRRGIHLLPIDAQEVHRLYVPLTAIRDVVSVQNLGRILVREGMLGAEALDRAVERQQELRQRRLGDILLERGAVNPDQVAKALDIQRAAPGKRIGDILLEVGFVSREQLGAAVEVQKMLRGKRLGELLVEMGFADPKAIAIALALQFNLPFVTLAAATLDPALREIVPANVALRWRFLPLSLERGVLTLALADPTQLDFKSELRSRTGMAVAEAVATPADLELALESYYE